MFRIYADVCRRDVFSAAYRYEWKRGENGRLLPMRNGAEERGMSQGEKTDPSRQALPDARPSAVSLFRVCPFFFCLTVSLTFCRACGGPYLFGAFRRMFCGICADVCRRDIFSGVRQEGKGGALNLDCHGQSLPVN